MKQQTEGKISVEEESPESVRAHALAQAIKSQGYILANFIGMQVKKPHRDHIGILKSRDAKEKSCLVFRWKKKRRAIFLGTLWIDNEVHGADPDENWVFDVYGKVNLKKMVDLAHMLPKPKHVNIEIKLICKRVVTESLYVTEGMDIPTP